MGKRQRLLLAVVVLFLMTVLYEPAICGKDFRAEAAQSVSVSTRDELQQALMVSGGLNIRLKSDITVSRCMRVRGNKIIDGGGKYRIRRKSAAAGTYKGTLLQMQGKELKLKNVVLSGSGKSPTVSGDVNGKLIEVDSGVVVLETGACLSSNYNVSSFTDGGGGITVHRGGRVVMKPGSEICDNLTITGGSGVRIEEGGTFVMEGGVIADNAVLGQRRDSGFDGRGGAVHNRGTALIQGGTITGNAAVLYEHAGEKYGGYGGAIYNQNNLVIAGGRIQKNTASFAGGALYTNESGVVHITGGTICDNRSPCQRGGGIYMSAKAVIHINGGSIRDNEARDGSQIFIGSNSGGKLDVSGGTIHGDADVIYSNGGIVSVAGGRITGSHHAVKTKGICEVRGGIIEGGSYGIYYSEGVLKVSGNPKINSIYQKENRAVTADQNIRMESSCELRPERYQVGDRLVHLTSGQASESVLPFFTLHKKKHYILETGEEGLYIGKEKYHVVFEANGGQGVMGEQQIYVDDEVHLKTCTYWREGYGFVGWAKKPVTVRKSSDIAYSDRAEVRNLGSGGQTVRLYALWVKKPVLTSQYDGLVFYEGEQADRAVIQKGMHATDEVDGILTEKIEIDHILLPDKSEQDLFESLPTGKDNLGKGEIVYYVVNSFGIRSEYRQSYEVLPNQAPEVTVWDRYYFVGEYEGKCTEQAKRDVLSRVQLSDDTESKQQLMKNQTVLWGGLDFQREGEYPVTVRVKDQYGHRYYMSQEEQRQYGIGKVCEKVFTVHVVQRENDISQTDKGGFVRFISGEYKETLGSDSVWRTEPYVSILSQSLGRDSRDAEEIWVISADDRKKVKTFINGLEQPFSRTANQLFLQQFLYMKRKER